MEDKNCPLKISQNQKTVFLPVAPRGAAGTRLA